MLLKLRTRQGEVFLFGGLWPPGGDPGQLRHVWGAAQGGPASRVAQVAAGWRHVLFLTEAGCIFALGDDDFGQCAGSGGGTAAIPLPSSAMAVGVAAGACHSLAWDATGAAFAWGHGGSGRLGLGGACKRPSPQRVDLAKPVCAASAGANFSLFVVNSGEELFACGGNQYGQLGIDASQAFTPVSVQIPLAEDEVITAVASGTNHVICLTQTDGDPADSQATVWAWGCASSGQCGPNAAFESQARPLKLGDFSPPSPHRAVAVAAGRSHSAVLAFTGNTARSRLRPARARTPRASAEKSVRPRAERSEQAEDIIEEFLTGLAPENLSLLLQPQRGFRASKLFVLLAAAVALLKLLPDLDFLGDSKPSVKPGGAYDGSDINPEEMGATEWEKNWWRDMKTQQEALNKKAAIEQARGDEDGEGIKTLLYLFGFLAFGTFLVFLPGPRQETPRKKAGQKVTMAEEALFMGEGVTEKVRNPTSELSSRLGGRLIRRSGQGQQENRRSAGRRPRREQRAPNPKPPTPKPTEPSVSKASRTKPGLGTGALLAEALAAEDQWSGIRESLKGLSSYIAQLSDTPVK
ncbi:Herc4, partial [Symbiodinium necroappetens]